MRQAARQLAEDLFEGEEEGEEEDLTVPPQPVYQGQTHVFTGLQGVVSTSDASSSPSYGAGAGTGMGGGGGVGRGSHLLRPAWMAPN